MRRLLVLGLYVLVGLACSSSVDGVHPSAGAVPRLPPPPPLVDIDAPDAFYRTAVALQIQPGWASFLDDCRVRLPANHGLNDLALATTVELVVRADGQLASSHVRSSGNIDFDRAVRQVIADAAPLPRPPRVLWSDDDQVHLVWLFARDRRQAGPATAVVTRHDLPVRAVVTRLVAAGDLGRAAERLRRAKDDPEREPATQLLMVAALREGLQSTDANVRRAAVEAIGRAGVRELVPAMRELLAASSDRELRLAGLDAGVRLGDGALVPIAAEHLRNDIRDDRRLAAAETAALVALGASNEAIAILRDELEHASEPALAALYALAHVWIPELGGRLTRWSSHRDGRVRAAACAGFAVAPADSAWPLIERGLRDRDASVRASCAHAAKGRQPQAGPDAGRVVSLLRALLKDRDVLVRARAIGALAVLAPSTLPTLVGSEDSPHVGSDPRTVERSTEVRRAYAAALAVARPADVEARLLPMLTDLDADVRAEAWTSWLTLPSGASTEADRARLAARAATDPTSQVRRAAVPALDDDALLLSLATGDDSAEVRTAAIVALAGRRGRLAAAELLLLRLGEAPSRSAERVRTGLAWLLAR